MAWLDKKIIFISGKGGVGKSTVALSLASFLAKEGHKTLLVELGEYSFFQDYLELPPVGYEPQMFSPNLFFAIWSGRSCLREYLLNFVKFESIYNLIFENRIMRALVDIAPGLTELAILGKITSGVRKISSPLNYDYIIVDTYSSGHALALFRAPGGLAGAIKYGPMGDQTREIDKVLRDESQCGYGIVTIPEELPCLEAISLYNSLREELGVTPEMILNKVLISPLNDKELLAGNAILENAFINHLHLSLQKQNKLHGELNMISGTCQTLPLALEVGNKKMIEYLANEIASFKWAH